jgi:hypothetical protein
LVRVGEGAEEIDAMRLAGRVGLRFETVGDALEWTPRQIEQAVTPTSDESAAQLRSRLLRFALDMRVGDMVVTPNTAHHELWLSTVTGPYEFTEHPVVPGYGHTRTATSLGWVDRSSPWVQHKLKYIDMPAAVELRDPDWWFLQVESVDLPLVRPLRARVVARPVAPARPSRARQSAPSLATPPKPLPPREPERVLCAGSCGLQWRVAVLANGLCPDCRGD